MNWLQRLGIALVVLGLSDPFVSRLSSTAAFVVLVGLVLFVAFGK